jgi:hypothetical protein
MKKIVLENLYTKAELDECGLAEMEVVDKDCNDILWVIGHELYKTEIAWKAPLVITKRLKRITIEFY